MGKPGNETINLTEDDYKRKSFKAAPAGTYTFLISKKSKLKKFKGGTSGLELILTITADGKGKKTKHEKVNVFDNIAASVGWKIAQLLNSLGIKKMKITVAELLELVKGKKLRAVIRVERYEGKDRNKIVQFLPLKPTDEEDADDTGDEDEDEEGEEEENDEAEADGEEDEEDGDEDEDDDADADDDDDDADEEDDEDEDEDEDEGGEDDDDDDEAEQEEEEKPKRVAKKPAAKKPAAKKPAGRKK